MSETKIKRIPYTYELGSDYSEFQKTIEYAINNLMGFSVDYDKSKILPPLDPSYYTNIIEHYNSTKFLMQFEQALKNSNLEYPKRNVTVNKSFNIQQNDYLLVKNKIFHKNSDKNRVLYEVNLLSLIPDILFLIYDENQRLRQNGLSKKDMTMYSEETLRHFIMTWSDLIIGCKGKDIENSFSNAMKLNPEFEKLLEWAAQEVAIEKNKYYSRDSVYRLDSFFKTAPPVYMNELTGIEFLKGLVVHFLNCMMNLIIWGTKNNKGLLIRGVNNYKIIVAAPNKSEILFTFRNTVLIPKIEEL